MNQGSVRLDPRWGGLERVSLEKLIASSQHSDPGVKYFSGTATYTKTLSVPAELLGQNRRLLLDLGRGQVIPQVTLNWHDLGILWKPPFRLDRTAAAKPGDNALAVRVVNLWINRQIGDEQVPEDSLRNPDGTLKEWPPWVKASQPSPTGRFTFTSWRL